MRGHRPPGYRFAHPRYDYGYDHDVSYPMRLSAFA